MCIFLGGAAVFKASLFCQVCAVERKEHASHTGAGSKKAKGSDAESRETTEGWYNAYFKADWSMPQALFLLMKKKMLFFLRG